MTDKIIIDEIDVSECLHFENADNETGCSLTCCGSCRTYNDCYYKQLKRKEQECKELKKTIQLQNKMQMEVVEEKNKEIENLRERNNFLIVRDKMLVDCEKKLQEKEQECEEKDEGIRYFKKCLDNSFKRQKDSELWWEKERNKLTQKLKEKEQECEELRNLFEDPKVRIALTDVRTGEREIWRKLGNKAQKYKQALEEIEKITNNRGMFCEHCNNEDDVFSCEDCGYCRILNIINKTEGNNV